MAQGVHRSPLVWEPAFEPPPVAGEHASPPASVWRLPAVPTLAMAAVLVGLVAVLAPGSPRQPVDGVGAAQSGAAAAVPFAARLAVSRALGADEHSYWVGPGLVARNAPQRLFTRFSATGASVATVGGRLGLSLVATGRGARLAPARPVAPIAHANRVSYPRAGLVEWFANGPSGLEQGLTLDRRPAGSGPLSFKFALSGSLHPHLGQGATVVLGGRRARVPLRYTGLSAYDARGRQLPSWLELRGSRLLIHVTDAGAVYPVRIDPVIARLTIPESGAELGASLAASGSILVAGAPTADSERGAAYVFVEPSTGWQDATQKAKLTTREDTEGNEFGEAVAVSQPASGPTKIVVGAQGVEATESESHAGAAYVFVEPHTGGWQNTEKPAVLTPKSREKDARFGTAVAVGTTSSGVATVAVGAPYASDGSGKAYVFEETEHDWTGTRHETKLLDDPNGGPEDGFGHSLAIPDDGATIVAGAPYADDYQGAVDVFARPASGWSGSVPTPAKLTALPAVLAELGDSVAASGSTIAAGAPYAANYYGAVYIFSEPGGGWKDATQTAELKSSDEGAGLGGTTALAAVPSCLSALTIGGAMPGSEAIYDFSAAQSGWISTADASSLAIPEPDASDYSQSVAASGTTAFAVEGNEVVDALGLKCPEAPKTVTAPITTAETTRTSTTTSTTSVSPTAASSLALGCLGGDVALLNVIEAGSHVKLTGAAAPSLIGKTVEIFFAGTQKVASATVGGNGLFSASAPLPPSKVRDSNTARYVAEIGKLKSPALKLTRRLILDPPTVAHGKVQLTGEVVPPLTQPISPIAVEEETTCTKRRVVEHVNPSSNGHFSITVAPPAGKSAVIYRLSSRVPANVSKTKSGPTASLPQVVALG